MEQGNVYDQFEKDTANPSRLSLKETLAKNPGIAKTVIPTFICPTDAGVDNSGLNENRPFTTAVSGQPSFLVGKSNYPGNAGNEANQGIFLSPNHVPPSGTHTTEKVPSKTIKINDILDGTSNTFAVGERATRSPKKITVANNCFAALWIGTSQENTLVNWDAGSSLWGLGFYRLQDGDSQTNLVEPFRGFSSLHPGGVNFLLCDGSVRFVRESVSWSDLDPAANKLDGTLNRLYNRADGLVVGEF
jgi:prepilin-type processing-associated H-X9-DG protein